MDDVRNRLDQDLKTAVSRLHHVGGAAVIEELPWTIRDSCPFADEVDGIQANESREVGLATRELLMERVNRLSAALDRISESAYGTCVECGDAISAVRLHAMPEVQTCVGCQSGLERLDRQVGRIIRLLEPRRPFVPACLLGGTLCICPRGAILLFLTLEKSGGASSCHGDLRCSGNVRIRLRDESNAL